MRTIDLHNSAASDVQYNIITFPDGELHIKLDDIDRKEEYNIVCRICNANDLFLLMQVGNILNNNQVEFTIDIMYLMSMRMDRIISFNEAYSLKLVADMINSLRAKSVRVFHAHSNKTLKLLNNSVDYETYYNHVVYPHIIKYDVICFPDAGAYKRYVLENDRKSVNDDDTDIIVLKKKRNLDTGIIEGMEVDTKYSTVSVNNYYSRRDNVRILVTDDLCDAGGTFLGALNILQQMYDNASIDIFVRHLVNPKGVENLSKVYNTVYTTNSYKDWDAECNYDNVIVINMKN